MSEKNQSLLFIEHRVGGNIERTTIEDPIRAYQEWDADRRGGLRIEFNPTREQLMETREGMPTFAAHTIEQAFCHLDEGEVPRGHSALDTLRQIMTDGFGSMVYMLGRLANGKPGDKFFALHRHAQNVHGIIITEDRKRVVLQRESRPGRVNKRPIIQGIKGGVKCLADVARCMRTEMLVEAGCRPGPDAHIYQVSWQEPRDAEPSTGFYMDDGVMGWPVNYLVAVGYRFEDGYSRPEENIEGIEVVALAEFKENCRRMRYSDLSLLALGATLELDEEGRFQGIAAPHRKVWDAREV